VDARIMTLLRIQELSEDPRFLAGRQGGRDFVREVKRLSGGTFEAVDALEFMNERTTFEDPAMLRASDECALGFIDACVAERVRPVVHNASFANRGPT
jgi:hypothetical protein